MSIVTPPPNTQRPKASIRSRWRGLELPTRVDFDEETQTGNFGTVVAEPFERGYGATVGNSIRRVLISSLEGTAVTHVRIKGVQHEFTTVPGIYEDVTSIILNIKKVLLKIETDEPVTLKIKKGSPGTVTAGDIQCDANTEVVNPREYICEITEQTEFDVEMTACTGRGYLSASEHGDGEQVIGLIPIDSIFSPVTRVRYRVEDTRVGKVTNYDKLIMDIWTDGTVSPEMALVEASKILRKHLNPFVQYFKLGQELQKRIVEEIVAGPIGIVPDEVDGASNELLGKLQMPITALDLSVRASNCIEAENVQTIGDLVARTEEEMLEVRNFGKTSLKEIKKKLTDFGLHLGMDVTG